LRKQNGQRAGSPAGRRGRRTCCEQGVGRRAKLKREPRKNKGASSV
jgi:hypothetical protein